ncbi:MAG TPA: hypothetical protein VH062_05665 [Polyangiaceae bacterium]|nr:hypothetical protein [Polyangiaceae bacterium]
MADDHRRRAPGQRGVEGLDPQMPESVALPEHASAYFSPRSPPVSTSHQTIETEAVRLDPAIDPDNAVTQPLNVEGLKPPPWLGERLRSDAPTVLVPIIRQRRRRRRLIAAIIAAAVGVLAGVVYGVTRPLSPRQTAGSTSAHVAATPAPEPDAVARDAPSLAAPAPPPPDETASAIETPTPSPTSGEKTTQPAATTAPTGHAQAVARPAHPAAGSPSAWLKSEPPKAWFK